MKSLCICLIALFMGHEQCNRRWILKIKKKKKKVLKRIYVKMQTQSKCLHNPSISTRAFMGKTWVLWFEGSIWYF